MNIYPYVDMTRANRDGSYPVYVIVKRGAGRFFVNTGLTTCGRLEGRLFPKADRNGRAKSSALTRYLADCERVCLSASSDVSNKDLKARLQREVFGTAVRQDDAGLVTRAVADFAQTKRDSTAVLYGITERKVQAFDQRATLDAVDEAWLERFRQWLMNDNQNENDNDNEKGAGGSSIRHKGLTVNGAAKELRNLRAVFNWARRRDMTRNYPFLDYHIPEADTEPRNISVEQLRQLRDYPCEDWQRRYRDFFMLSFYMAGINPVDLLLMRRDQMRDGHVTFVRRKTDKQGQHRQRTVTLPLLPEAVSIIQRYPSKEGYLLGFMDGRQDYHSFEKEANKALKKIGTRELVPDRVGRLRKVVYHPLHPDITLYTARYTFASLAANDLDISERTIALCLGHSWAKQVTSRYLSNDQRKIDDAVRRVVEYVEEK